MKAIVTFQKIRRKRDNEEKCEEGMEANFVSEGNKTSKKKEKERQRRKM